MCRLGRSRRFTSTQFLTGRAYRSVYLDELYSNPENAAAGAAGKPLDKGLRQFIEKSHAMMTPGQSLAGQIVCIMETCKTQEIKNLGIKSQENCGGDNPFNMILENIAQSASFRMSGKWWRKPINTALERRCKIDMGRRNSWKTSTPLEFEIGYIDKDVFSYDLSLMHRVIPGFQHYRLYTNPPTAVLGIVAQVNYLDIMGDLITRQA